MYEAKHNSIAERCCFRKMKQYEEEQLNILIITYGLRVIDVTSAVLNTRN